MVSPLYLMWYFHNTLSWTNHDSSILIGRAHNCLVRNFKSKKPGGIVDTVFCPGLASCFGSKVRILLSIFSPILSMSTQSNVWVLGLLIMILYYILCFVRIMYVIVLIYIIYYFILVFIHITIIYVFCM